MKTSDIIIVHPGSDDKFEALKASGELENMCSSEVYTYFGITREFPDGESV